MDCETMRQVHYIFEILDKCRENMIKSTDDLTQNQLNDYLYFMFNDYINT